MLVLPPGATGAAGNPYSWQLAGGGSTVAYGVAGDGISIIARTVVTGIPQPVGEILTDMFTAGPADYGEYCEWYDGNPDSEDRTGYFVQFKDDKVEFAQDSSTVAGIVSKTSNVAGDAAEMHWHGVNERDKFGAIVTVDDYLTPMKEIMLRYKLKCDACNDSKSVVISDLIANNRERLRNLLNVKFNRIIETNYQSAEIVPTKLSDLTSEEYTSIAEEHVATTIDQLTEMYLIKIENLLENVSPHPTAVVSESYVPDGEYVPRSKRKEWSIVGMLGKIYVRDNGKCVVNGKCDCLNGIAVPGNKWHVLSRVDTDVIRVYFK
jgi:hypothetical protein